MRAMRLLGIIKLLPVKFLITVARQLISTMSPVKSVPSICTRSPTANERSTLSAMPENKSQIIAGIRNKSKKSTGTPSRFGVSLLILPQLFSCRQGYGQVVDHHDFDACLPPPSEYPQARLRYNTEEMVQTTRANVKRGSIL